MDDLRCLSESNLCRTCMTPGTEFISLFNLISILNKKETLDTILQKCTSVQVLKNDAFPQYICNICLERLTSAYLFRELCLESEHKFKQFSVRQTERFSNEESSNCDDFIEDVKQEDSEEETVISSLSSLKHFCHYCNRSFSTKYAMQKHRKTHLNCHDLRFKQRAKPFKCPICGALYTQGVSLSKHLQRHKDYQNKELSLKLEESHRHFVCPKCGKSFKQFSDLTLHLRRHEGVKPYICKYCGLKYFNINLLKVHLRVHIPADRPFICNICNKRFAQSYAIAKHMRWHAWQKKYNCNYCCKSFSSMYNLNVHKKDHEQPQECDHCHKSFSDPKNIKQHKNMKFLCSSCGKNFNRRSHHVKSQIEIHHERNN